VIRATSYCEQRDRMWICGGIRWNRGQEDCSYFQRRAGEMEPHWPACKFYNPFDVKRRCYCEEAHLERKMEDL